MSSQNKNNTNRKHQKKKQKMKVAFHHCLIGASLFAGILQPTTAQTNREMFTKSSGTHFVWKAGEHGQDLECGFGEVLVGVCTR